MRLSKTGLFWGLLVPLLALWISSLCLAPPAKADPVETNAPITVFGDWYWITNTFFSAEDAYVYTVQLSAPGSNTNRFTDYQIRKAKDLYAAKGLGCEICGIKKSLESKNRNPIHHKIPVSFAPWLAVDQANLVELCIGHHKTVGHPNGYKGYNRHIIQDMELLRVIYRHIRERAVLK